jgi:hypothetical protein
MKKRWVILFCWVSLVLILGRGAAYYDGAVPLAHVPLDPGNVAVPTERS